MNQQAMIGLSPTKELLLRPALMGLLEEQFPGNTVFSLAQLEQLIDLNKGLLRLGEVTH